MISWWDWRKAIFGKLNQNYRETFLREDKTQIRIVIAVVAIWVLGHSIVEYLDLGLAPSFYLLAILRFLFFSGTLLLVLKIPNINDLDKLDLATLYWAVAVVLLSLISNIIRKNLHTDNVNNSLAWVLGFYLILPNRQLYKTIPALLLSLISFYTLFSPENMELHSTTEPALLANISSIIAMNVIDFLTSIRLESHRY